MTAVVWLAPQLTPENAEELLSAAAHKTVLEVRQLLAEKFPRPDLPTRVELRSPAVSKDLHALKHVAGMEWQGLTTPNGCHEPTEPAHARVTPCSADRVAIQFTMSREAYEKLRYARELLGHAVPSGEIGEVFRRAVRALIEKLEKRRFAASSRMGTRRSRGLGRYVPAEVRRAVVKRDGGQCTYVSESGHRCCSRMRLEFDHVTPVAQGGRSTVDGIRLLCRAHNQLAAEQRLGKPFMQAKRELAQRHRAEARSQRNAADARARARRAAVTTPAPASPEDDDVVKALRTLGFKPQEARGAASAALEAMPGGSVEDRLRHALRQLAPRCERRPVRIALEPPAHSPRSGAWCRPMALEATRSSRARGPHPRNSRDRSSGPATPSRPAPKGPPHPCVRFRAPRD